MSDEDFLAQFERIHRRFDESDRRMDQLEMRIVETNTRIDDLETSMRDDLERVETRLLTEFHKWASPTESRILTYREQIRTLDLELDALKDRVAKLEKLDKAS